LHVAKVGGLAARLQIMVGWKRVEAGWRMVGKHSFRNAAGIKVQILGSDMGCGV